MTLSVTPDDLGPVTIRAHVGADGVRVELFAPNDAGREALRAILQDLKRDLASAGLGADLDLSSQNQPDEPETGGFERPRDSANQEDTTGRQLGGPGHHAGPYLCLSGSETGLDVLA
jgi:flagellar hook-length control protein FliK